MDASENNGIQITAINCQMGSSIVVGYSSGMAKLFNLKTLKEERFFVAQNQEDFNSSVNHISVNKEGKHVFLAHEEYYKGADQKISRLQKTPI